MVPVLSLRDAKQHRAKCHNNSREADHQNGQRGRDEKSFAIFADADRRASEGVL
jgi:hypothetical protein